MRTLSHILITGIGIAGMVTNNIWLLLGACILIVTAIITREGE